MKSRLIYFLLFFVFLFSFSCNKSTTGPPNCRAIIKIGFFSKTNGENLNIENTQYLNNIVIRNIVLFDDKLIVDIDSINFYNNNESNIQLYNFNSNTKFDICKEQTYLYPTTEKFIIKYGEGIPADSLFFKYEKIKNIFQTTYFLNDSLIGTVESLEEFQTEFYPPVINIKK